MPQFPERESRSEKSFGQAEKWAERICVDRMRELEVFVHTRMKHVEGSRLLGCRIRRDAALASPRARLAQRP